MAWWLIRGSLLGRQTLALNGQRLRRSKSSASLISQSATPNPSGESVKSLASYVTTKIDEFIKFGDPPFPIFYAAEVYMNRHVPEYPEIMRPSVSLLVANLIKNFPQVDHIQIYHALTYYQSVLFHDVVFDKSDNTNIISATVFEVVQSYPKVGNYKVTKETHFVEDLRFGKWDCIEVLQALQVAFKLYIPDEIVSCKLAIEYICDHINERLSLEEFQKHLYMTGEFGESKSEFRKLFVPPNVETSSYYTKLGITKLVPLDESEMFSWKGLNLHQYIENV